MNVFGLCFQKRGKEKDRINLCDVKVVEEVDETALEKPFGIQVRYKTTEYFTNTFDASDA